MPLRSALLLVALASCGPAIDPLAGLTVVTEDPTDLPLPDLDARWSQRFVDGDAAFEAPHRAADGLGPLFIRQSCNSCHAADAKGPGSVTKMVLVDSDGKFAADQSALTWGHTVRAQLTAGAAKPIVPPDAGVFTSLRMGPAVFGRGALEAIEDAEIERLEREPRGGVSGRIHRVCRASEANPDQPFHAYAKGQCNLIGRFGLKARIATLDDFSADAYQGDMGLTSPLRPTELPNPDGLSDDDFPGLDLELETVNLASDYVRLIAMPRRPAPKVDDGPVLFAQAQCDTCHVPTLRTRADYPIPGWAGREVAVFTDLLLHDLGGRLADGLLEGDASGSEWRTAPLIGLRHLERFLHDGRALTLDAAIEAHASPGSEANASVDAYRSLSPEERERLLSYLRTL